VSIRTGDTVLFSAVTISKDIREGTDFSRFKWNIAKSFTPPDVFRAAISSANPNPLKKKS
jgi:hypothetical protein